MKVIVIDDGIEDPIALGPYYEDDIERIATFLTSINADFRIITLSTFPEVFSPQRM